MRLVNNLKNKTAPVKIAQVFLASSLWRDYEASCSLFLFVTENIKSQWALVNCSERSRIVFIFLLSPRTLQASYLSMTSVTDAVPKAGEFPTLGLSGRCFFLDWKLIAPVCASYSWICSQNSYKRRIGQARSRTLGNLTFLPLQNNLLEMVGETKAQTWQLADLLTKNEVILRLIVKLIKNGISVPLVVLKWGWEKWTKMK